MNPFKALTILLVTASLLSGCNGQTESKSVDDKATSAKVKAPKIAIHDAVISGNTEAVKQHIAAGSDLNTKDPFGGASPLIIATVFDKIDIAKLLIEAGADLNMKNNDGSTAIHTAAFFCRTEALDALLKAGADKSLKNNFGMTAYESVLVPFAEVEPVYKMMGQQLAPMGMQLDMERIKNTRSQVADMLK